MSKYIDSEKLIAEIEKKKKILVSEYNELAKYEVWRSANEDKIKINTISDILSLITSLQQDQPEVDLEIEFGRWIDKLDDKYCVSIKDYSMQDMKDTARHFYELGRARKEESVSIAESPSKTFPRVNEFDCGSSYRH